MNIKSKIISTLFLGVTNMDLNTYGYRAGIQKEGDKAFLRIPFDTKEEVLEAERILYIDSPINTPLRHGPGLCGFCSNYNLSVSMEKIADLLG